MDHAGIATQHVVERSLRKEGKTRHDLGRAEFVRRVWQWKEQYGGVIVTQLRTLGASCDWEREKFTMDETLSAAVREVFVRLYDDGLIYRGKYIVNWCPHDHTAISDDEVTYTEQQGKLWYIRYPLSRPEGAFLTVATTRPVTPPSPSTRMMNGMRISSAARPSFLLLRGKYPSSPMRGLIPLSGPGRSKSPLHTTRTTFSSASGTDSDRSPSSTFPPG
jgi:hypothetical protein